MPKIKTKRRNRTKKGKKPEITIHEEAFKPRITISFEEYILSLDKTCKENKAINDRPSKSYKKVDFDSQAEPVPFLKKSPVDQCFPLSAKRKSHMHNCHSIKSILKRSENGSDGLLSPFK